MSDDKNCHKGHRQRILKKYSQYGIHALEEHEILEILLFFAFSRCNTNEISHHLINKFGSIKKVFNAGVDELTKINGIGESSAVLLRFLGDFIDDFAIKKDQDVRLNDLDTITDFCLNNYPNTESESIHFILLDKKKSISTTIDLTGCAFDIITIDLKSVISRALTVNASSVILVHNHPNASCVASNSDVRYTRSITESLMNVNINVIDHIIIGYDGLFSMRRAKLLEDLWN